MSPLQKSRQGLQVRRTASVPLRGGEENLLASCAENDPRK